MQVSPVREWLVSFFLQFQTRKCFTKYLEATPTFAEFATMQAKSNLMCDVTFWPNTPTLDFLAIYVTSLGPKRVID